ncbi:MAG: hypothetical protein AUJ98_04745 [Bacteroidetes bacterium CG2_30_33_31]|nr:MAG: hypothetical protein AUJ98_04745 [Bacteroidetes bacterium CG2_30_33_31]
MRRIFSDYIEGIADTHKELIFLTGDLGFDAFEKLKTKLGERFINAGIAEQSMVSVAAGLASQGHIVFVYSIAPFLVYRALEQIRNDVCFHEMPVIIVGNGGGYGYGIMGSSHHALSDIATISSLPNIKSYIPAFKEDVGLCLDAIVKNRKPAYVRLGLARSFDENKKEINDFSQLLSNKDSKLTIAALGPIVWNIFDSEKFEEFKCQLDIFTINKIPFENLSKEFFKSLKKTKKLLVVEEHVQHGGLASSLALKILEQDIDIEIFKSKYAVNYPNNLYGNQIYHQEQSGLDIAALTKDINSILSK